ncbi:Deaminated glutathione amidase [Bienertia sinuspersici]
MRQKCCGKKLQEEKKVHYTLILSPVAFDLVAFHPSTFPTLKNSFLLIAAPLTLSSLPSYILVHAYLDLWFSFFF